MEKMKMQSENLVDENVEKIAKLFPNCVTEGKDEDGKVVRAVDFDLLKQELSKNLVEGNDERYTLNWAGKKQSILTANSPINATLRPCEKESVGKDGTPGGWDSQNLYIEGDNLDVLKLLRETYLNKIKMIYIDPPYNTGNDFVYNDDFATSADEYLQNSKSYDEDGNRMVQNLESNGRFHSDWLSMMYPRLKLAKDLLTEDGVVFVSMADNEIANLLKICEEIFGKHNIEIFVWKKKGGAGNTEKIIGVLTEYIVCCFKNKKPYALNYQIFKREYKFSDEKGPYNLEGIEKTNLGGYERKTMQFAIVDPQTNTSFYPSENMRWTIGLDTANELIKNNKLFFDYKNKKVKRIKRPQDYDNSENVYYNLLTDEGSLSVAKDECCELLGNREYFDTPKPTALIKKLLKIGSKGSSIILDFFSGSATTAHSVMQLNAEDGGNRKFIMVQLAEKTDEKSEAYKAGYKNICEIGKERIRRAGKKIVEEIKNASITFGKNRKDVKEMSADERKSFDKAINMASEKLNQEDGLKNLEDFMNQADRTIPDIGFRVLKLDSSNMKDVYYTPAETPQGSLLDLVSNIKEDRSPEDLLFQVMLDMGVMLDSKIEKIELSASKQAFNVNDGNLICCFDINLSEEDVTKIAKMQPLYAVFRDSSMSSDSVAVNFDQIFETYSPSTTRKVL